MKTSSEHQAAAAEALRTPHLDAALNQARANMRIVDIRQLDVEIALLQMEDKELRER